MFGQKIFPENGSVLGVKKVKILVLLKLFAISHVQKF